MQISKHILMGKAIVNLGPPNIKLVYVILNNLIEFGFFNRILNFKLNLLQNEIFCLFFPVLTNRKM